MDCLPLLSVCGYSASLDFEGRKSVAKLWIPVGIYDLRDMLNVSRAYFKYDARKGNWNITKKQGIPRAPLGSLRRGLAHLFYSKDK